ncbi:hypothetical protein K2173_011589 [Erythroxylum novogranatense]|uniref:Vacuolar protein-sorting-associated protein 36 n=1 Tax=Erythroxylum novogranatense TaxID=1862640 RepID=A0AAV8U4Z3_9ROSI|nr:hypothetical protein K2173_011589 [Erythroxylum novogranatense]
MAGNTEDQTFFPTAAVTGSGRPVLLPNEVECQLLSAVDLEFEERSPPGIADLSPALKSGLLILTTHRLLWLPANSLNSSATAIPLSSVVHIFSPKKSIKSMFHSPRIRIQVSMHSRSMVVTLVVRGKGDLDGFLGKLFESWRGKAWEADTCVTGSVSGSSMGSGSSSGRGGIYSSDGTVKMAGLTGILRKEQENWESTDKSLQDAFRDLNALMSKAKEMVMLADKMRQKLLSSSNAQSSEGNDDETGSREEIQDMLLSVGIISPVTKESAGALYHQQLARQLADFVRIPLERAGGMISLIDIYCLFNRARGTELISPEDLQRACSLWEKFDVPVMLRKFDSGVMVIQSKAHSDEEVFARIRTLVTRPDALRTGISASDAAIALGIAPAMAKEHLLSAEIKGLLCRDISPDGFRFYANIFSEFDANSLYLVKDHSIYSAWVQAVSLRAI